MPSENEKPSERIRHLLQQKVPPGSDTLALAMQSGALIMDELDRMHERQETQEKRIAMLQSDMDEVWAKMKGYQNS